MAQYGIVDYWNKRYTEADHVTLKIIKEYDWYVDAEDAKNLVISYLAGKLEAKILIVGCGISLLTRELYKEGFKNLTAIDYSCKMVNPQIVFLRKSKRFLEAKCVETISQGTFAIFRGKMC